MQLNLTGQTVAVIGSSNGIGRAVAAGFLAEGCHVRGFDRVAPSDLTGPDPIATTLGDVTAFAEVKAFAATFPSVDHVVFTVGVGSGKFGFPFWNLDPADWARVLDINLIGAVNVAHAFAPALIARGGGSFLVFVSVAGQIGSQSDPPYSAAKAGLINFMQCAAKDFAPHGVRANAISPGMVQTALNQSVWAAAQNLLPADQRRSYADWAGEKIRKIAPLGRWQTPAEFAALATFLASDHAKNITGQTLNVDGGQVMHS
ncbi:MAG: SDR family NAD(P)-dependent oxidoreductase [Verrucomicrobia bacterium]|nr:SDR family NAD(P)-dependent oxidoreductase [Verrucomicrobiota bacterium]